MTRTRTIFSGGAAAAAAAGLALALGAGGAADAANQARRPAPPLTRYSVVHGCYRLRAPNGHGIAGPVRMQAAALGQYLLYTEYRQYVNDAGHGKVASQVDPSPAVVWRLDGTARRGFTLTNQGTKTRLRVRFVPARGCAVYPEAQVGAQGNSFRGASPAGAVLGTVEGHAHVTAFELFGGDWHCGMPFSPYGAPYALPASCADKEQGTNGQVEAALDFGGPRPSDFHGWPTFKEWPSPSALAEEGDYWTAIERAWKAGLRLMVSDDVDNEQLCGLMTTSHHACNDMISSGIQSHDLFALQNYIDAQSGGPGRGWFRIVTDPFAARQVINQGKLAVVQGIEVSRLLGCGEMNGVPQCDRAQIDAGLNQVQRWGVSTLFPVHEFDNAFGGTKGISGSTGLIVNAGNRQATGSFMTMQPCPASEQDAEQVTPPSSGPEAALLNGPVASLTGGNPLPVYGDGPQCNTRDLTDLGAYLIRQMAKRHLIIQTDHSGSKTASSEVKVAESVHYPGIVSAHCCNSPQLFPRLYKLGGFVDPPVSTPASFVSAWKADRAVRDRRFHFGFGYGSDMNGLAHQPGPTGTMTYPFRAYVGGVRFAREVWGQRSFDYARDGLANYGLYADWLNQVQRAGGRAIMNDMFQGAEAYLEMWERAFGVRSGGCLASAAATRRSLHAGMSFRAVLLALGQPASRGARSYRYRLCRGGTAVLGFDSRAGRLTTLGIG